ncbi:hypothetical protein Rt10032_c23g6651 [Rhodotorula toruloides]|uniref:Uncharacterized protein n=1 Tax=Rhodotorula toruloides TaxID=5286 RepID=A0A511KSW0_RHOTO|nr:hypothetical protein Rt10032_c23g6651 [Rhodotorula toruloides]
MQAPATRFAAAAARPAARRALPRPQAYRRTYATAQEASTAGTAGSHFGSALLGGGVVLGGLYAWYSMSGAKTAVDTARSVSHTATAAKDKLKDVAPNNAKEALNLAKSVAKSYASAIPGGAVLIDQGFDQLESFVDTHGEKAAQIVKDTYADIEKAAKGGKDSGDQIMRALQEAGNKIQALVGEEASKGWKALGAKYPELQKSLGSQGDELKKLTDKHGPEAQRIATDFYAQATKIVSQGGLNAETYDAVKKLLAEKKDELAQFSQKAGRDAWDASAKAAGPVLDKMPDVKEALDKNLSKLEGYVGEDRVKIVKELYSELEKIGKSDKSVEEKTKAAKQLVQDKLGDSSQFKALGLGMDKIEDLASQGSKWLDSQVPGLSGLTKVFQETDLKALKDLASKRSDDAEKILNETYDQIKEILQKQADKAKKLGEETKEDAKKQAK